MNCLCEIWFCFNACANVCHFSLYNMICFSFVFLEGEKREWVVVIMCEKKKWLKKLRKKCYFNEIEYVIDNPMWIFWKIVSYNRKKKCSYSKIENNFCINLCECYKWICIFLSKKNLDNKISTIKWRNKQDLKWTRKAMITNILEFLFFYEKDEICII